MPYAYEYLIWFLPFMAVDFMAMGTNGCIRSEGNPHLAMKIAVTGALINIVLDPVFLFVFHMGVKGVAIATVIARIYTAGSVIWHFTLSKNHYLKLKRKNLMPKWEIVKPMLAIGALGAIQSIFIMVETPLRGLMMAGQPIIGYNFGAKIYKRVKSTLKVSYLYSLIISLTGFAIVNIWVAL